MIAAVVPAAGLSRRMGQPKLLLPIDGVPLITRVVRAFQTGGADRVVVVVAPPDVPGAAEVATLARSAGAAVVVAPVPTADMRASVVLGLGHLAAGPPSALLLTPGDSPGINPDLVARLIDHGSRAPGRIIIPRHDGQPGHPALIPWDLATLIPNLSPGAGVRALFARHAERVDYLDTDDSTILLDLDVPADYARWSSDG